eukprot:717550-Rhodomonas_salina.4
MVLLAAIGLCACYAMSGTGISYAAGISLPRYARAVRCPVLPYAMHLRIRYAMSSTDICSAAIGLRSCCALPGTDIGYAATRSKRHLSL